MDWYRKWLVDFNAGKMLLVLFDQSNNTSVIDIKGMGLFLRKNDLLRCWGWLSLLNCIGALTLFLLLNLPLRKLNSWFVLWRFFFLGLLCISINLPYSHAWNTIFMSGLKFLVASLNYYLSYKNRYVTVGPLLAVSLQHLTHHWNVASLSYFYRYYFGSCSSELVQLVLLPYSRGSSTRYFARFHDFSVTISIWYKISVSAVSFLAQLGSRILFL